MSLILNEKYVGKNGSYSLFLSNRLLRLFPIYWTVLLLTMVFLVVLYLNTGRWVSAPGYFVKYHQHMGFSSMLLLGFTNIFLLGQDLVMFLGLDTRTGQLFFTKDFLTTDPPLYAFLLVPQAWTIGVEILFYIIAPFIVRRSLKVIGLVIALSLFASWMVIHKGLNPDPWLVRFFPTQLVFFMMGTVGYRVYKRIERVEINKKYLLAIVLVPILFTIFFSVLPLPKKTVFYLVAFAAALPFVFKYTKRIKWDNKIGELSYPVYISHLLVYYVIGNWPLTRLLGDGLSTTICTILVSIILTMLVTNPIEKIRQRRVSSSPRQVPVV